MRCDNCEALMINGLFCHETGCPNTHARYDADEDIWIKQVKCFDCGCMVDVGTPRYPACCGMDDEELEQ
jgi:hypothetical protein